MKPFSLLLVLLGLWACSPDDSKNSNHNQQPGASVFDRMHFVPVNRLLLLDALGNPMSQQTMVLTPAAGGTPSEHTSDQDGYISGLNLGAGDYELRHLDLGQTHAWLDFSVSERNLLATLSLQGRRYFDGEAMSWQEAKTRGRFISLSGLVYADQKPLAHADVSLHRLTDLTGNVVSTRTNAKGEFQLHLSSESFLLGMLMVQHPEHASAYQRLRLGASMAKGGLNVELANKGSQAPVHLHCPFQASNQDGCTGWQNSNSSPASLAWRPLPEQQVINAGYINMRARLAPDDQSGGALPEPPGYWFGQLASQPLGGQGNYLGQPATINSNGSQNPVTGSFVSGVIDLRELSPPLSLSLNTWWEVDTNQIMGGLIPGYNNDNRGPDLMMIEASTDGQNWSLLTILRPWHSQGVQVNGSLYGTSNAGFNRAPYWQWSSPVNISDYAGRNLRLRLRFHSVNTEGNAFRGWAVREWKITEEMGSLSRHFEGQAAPFDELQLSLIKPKPSIAGSGQQMHSQTLDYDGGLDFSVLAHYPELSSDQWLQLVRFDDKGNMQVLNRLPKGQKTGMLTANVLVDSRGAYSLSVEATNDQGIPTAITEVGYNVLGGR